MDGNKKFLHVNLNTPYLLFEQKSYYNLFNNDYDFYNIFDMIVKEDNEKPIINEVTIKILKQVNFFLLNQDLNKVLENLLSLNFMNFHSKKYDVYSCKLSCEQIYEIITKLFKFLKNFSNSKNNSKKIIIQEVEKNFEIKNFNMDFRKQNDERDLFYRKKDKSFDPTSSKFTQMKSLNLFKGDMEIDSLLTDDFSFLTEMNINSTKKDFEIKLLDMNHKLLFEKLCELKLGLSFENLTELDHNNSAIRKQKQKKNYIIN